MSKSPTNKKLYNRVKSIAKRKFKKWPSAYASSWLVKEYKRLGGTYSGSRKSIKSGLSRWHAEEWINICKLPKIVPCGRSKLKSYNWKKNYPYCRPRRIITGKTPRSARELSKYEIKKRCSLKRKSPLKILTRKKSVRKSRKRSVRKSRKRSVRKSRKRSVRKSRKKSVKKSRRKSRRKSRK